MGEGSTRECVQHMATAAYEVLQLTASMSVGGIIKLEVRMGMHVGPAVGAVLCLNRPKYTLFGPALSVAMAFQRLAAPSSVACSADVASKLPVRALFGSLQLGAFGGSVGNVLL